MMRIIALLTARGGSKGLSGKNTRMLAGKPLLAWSVEAARASGVVQRIIVSTDDAGIADAARTVGAEVPFVRPAELARDNSPHVPVCLHALDWLLAQGEPEPDYLLLLQPTSPLRTAEDIRAAAALAERHRPPAVVSVVEARPHPQKTYRLGPYGELADFFPAPAGYRRRQDLAPAFADNGAIYLNRPDSLRRDGKHIPPGTLPYVMPPERSLDIDSLFDFRLAEFLLTQGAAFISTP